MFHFTERRIEAHVCICFIAYKVYKELERLIAINKIGMSVDKVLEAAKTVAFDKKIYFAYTALKPFGNLFV